MSAKYIHQLVKSENWPKAWFAVNAALNDAPDSPELLYLAGCVLRSQGHIGMSLPLFGKALMILAHMEMIKGSRERQVILFRIILSGIYLADLRLIRLMVYILAHAN